MHLLVNRQKKTSSK